MFAVCVCLYVCETMSIQKAIVMGFRIAKLGIIIYNLRNWHLPPFFCSLYYVIEHSEITSFMFKVLVVGNPVYLWMCAPQCHTIDTTWCYISLCNKRSSLFSKVSDSLCSSVAACVRRMTIGQCEAGECRLEHLDCLGPIPALLLTNHGLWARYQTTHLCSVPCQGRRWHVTGLLWSIHEQMSVTPLEESLADHK